jgi:class 3 adenylate cyclase
MLVCSRCGHENLDDARFCSACGAALAEAGRTEEERRIVSVLFVDLVGSTARAERLDPEDVRDVITPYFERVRLEIEGFGGVVEKFIGDAVMGLFGAPVARGDDPERAVRAALAVKDGLAEMNEANPALDLQIRLAVNTGEAIVSLAARPSHGEAMVAGDVVNTAARLQSAAPVNGIIVGEETYVSTRSVIDYEPVEAVQAKGKELPVPAWLAVGAHAEAGERLPSPIPVVGRAHELEVLLRIWQRVSQERRPQLVTVFGPTGIGKSRLAQELDYFVSESGGKTLRGRSVAYGGNSPYGAFAQHVKQVAGVFDNDELAVAYGKLRAAVTALTDVQDPDEVASHLAILMGLQTEGEVSDRETLFFSARLLAEGLARRRPTVLVFEDIHWADASLLDLIEILAGRIRDVPLMLLTLARPELLSERPAWGGGLPAYTALPLEPLAEQDATELARRLLEHHRFGAEEERAAAIAGTGEGNPLFIEELAASLADRAATDVSELPTSIRGIVSARLDALPAAERTVLLNAAVVGRVFWRGMLEREDPATGDLSTVLGSLEQRDLIARDAVSAIQGEQQFAFKHGLIREVAYQTLPRAERRARHAEVARFLEEATHELGDSAIAIAYQWHEAGEDERALSYLLAAADQAGRGWAKERAVYLYQEALKLVPEDDREVRRAIRVRQVVAMQAVYHLPDAERLRGPVPEEA